MQPSLWGPAAWKFLLSVALNYPDQPSPEDVFYYRTFLRTFPYVLPCEACRENSLPLFEEHLVEEALRSRTDLVKYIIDIHNAVNFKLGKPLRTYGDVMYEFSFGQ
jgi:hypothetical protein